MKRPKGALKANDGEGQLTLEFPFYIVSNNNGELDHFYKGKYGAEKTDTVVYEWVSGQLGFTFSNYFHALAFSLKCKSRKNEAA